MDDKQEAGEVEGGDVVRLNSGGPLMLVLRVEPGGGAFCVWAMSQSGGAQFSHFDVRTIAIVQKGRAAANP